MKREGPSKSVIIFAILFLLIVSIAIRGNLKAARHCPVEHCPYEKEQGKPYCIHHACREPGCTEQTRYDGKYCAIHLPAHPEAAPRAPVQTFSNECRKEGCSAPQAYGSVYCTAHTCHAAGCYNGVAEGSIYCAKHKPSSGSKNTASRHSSYKSSSSYSDDYPRDADDLDVEGLYEDYPDEFVDVDDAWDELEDDPDEWDDYY